MLTCLQQSVMNFGILMVQGLVNSFGTVVMAAFAAAVKIDAFAYMPLQDFGNAFSTFIAQNYGAGRKDRIRKGICSAALTSVLFALAVSAIVVICAKPLLLIFVHAQETQILEVGMSYLRVVGAFYCGIGILFLLYGLYRAINRPAVSLCLLLFLWERGLYWRICYLQSLPLGSLVSGGQFQLAGFLRMQQELHGMR